MKKIFITGSTTGLGFLAGNSLLEKGHQVVLHARSEKSAQEAKKKIGKDVPFVIGDVSTLDEIKSVAKQANALGPFDAIIHNVGIYETNAEVVTRDGLRTMFAVNVLTPFVLSTLLARPERMVFLSSGMHQSGEFNMTDPQWEKRLWNYTQAYSDSKLYDLMLTKYFARNWPGTYVNAVDPGWVPTRMGGAGAPDNLMKGAETQIWLAISNDPEALVTGKYFHHKEQRKSNSLADSERNQDELVSYLRKIS
ncbi:SDR family NAD(P)-dependent oxidoreductase [Peredibacter starrii]|uniref:SDR family NAD(P)-dependent oxidoreductase n=1 Tax=Peredibacter starrii TaxID=28202 RepID=A0AAX4HTM2_9BACT|nr:SDR family NAD(P)-dependent oxidoreductase [Peredibacter starrii]WPU66562.1 SDR family NAD(P)-dependent oxidoreductase [Peredibacter starrii]